MQWRVTITLISSFWSVFYSRVHIPKLPSTFSPVAHQAHSVLLLTRPIQYLLIPKMHFAMINYLNRLRSEWMNAVWDINGMLAYAPESAHLMHSTTVKIWMKVIVIQKYAIGLPWKTMLGLQLHAVARACEPVSSRIANMMWNRKKCGDHFRLTTKKYMVKKITRKSHPGSRAIVSMKA